MSFRIPHLGIRMSYYIKVWVGDPFAALGFVARAQQPSSLRVPQPPSCYSTLPTDAPSSEVRLPGMYSDGKHCLLFPSHAQGTMTSPALPWVSSVARQILRCRVCRPARILELAPQSPPHRRLPDSRPISNHSHRDPHNARPPRLAPRQVVRAVHATCGRS
jgi:hypothetical protein